MFDIQQRPRLSNNIIIILLVEISLRSVWLRVVVPQVSVIVLGDVWSRGRSS